MKRIISLLTVVILIMSLCVTASATASSVLSGDTEVTVGSEIEFAVNISDCGKATSIAVSVSFGGGF